MYFIFIERYNKPHDDAVASIDKADLGQHRCCGVCVACGESTEAGAAANSRIE